MYQQTQYIQSVQQYAQYAEQPVQHFAEYAARPAAAAHPFAGVERRISRAARRRVHSRERRVRRARTAAGHSA